MGTGLGSVVGGSTKYSATLNGAEIVKTNNGLKGFLGGAIAGVQKDLGSFVLGAELFLGIRTAKLSKNANGQKLKITYKTPLEIATRLGWKVTDDVQIYARLGIENAEFTRDLPLDGITTGLQAKHKKRLTGLVFGGGVEARVTDTFLGRT